MTETVWPEQSYTSADKRVHHQLQEEMVGSSHGMLFTPREFGHEHDSLGLMHLENAHIPALPFNAERFAWLKKEILWPLIITEDAFNNLVDGMDEALQRDEVIDHLSSPERGSLVWGSNHISYADVAAFEAARTEVNVRRGIGEPTLGHHAIASRLVSMFAMPGLLDGVQQGYVVDDGLLYLGGYLQTVPASASGSRLRHLAGSDVNAPVRQKFHQLLNRGSEFFIALSGTQDKPNDDKSALVMDTVSRGTVALLTEPNEVEGAERVMTIPVFIDCNPFTNGSFSGAVDATFRMLSPRFLRGEHDMTATMEDIARVGTIEKRSGTLPIEYRKPTVVGQALGKMGVGSKDAGVYKD